MAREERAGEEREEREGERGKEREREGRGREAHSEYVIDASIQPSPAATTAARKLLGCMMFSQRMRDGQIYEIACLRMFLVCARACLTDRRNVARPRDNSHLARH